MGNYTETVKLLEYLDVMISALSFPLSVAGEDAKAYVEGFKEARSVVERFPTADAAPVVHGKPVTKMHTATLTGYHEEIGTFAEDGANLYRKKMIHADIPYYHCPVCGAILCSRWHNYCGKCGTRMDLEEADNG